MLLSCDWSPLDSDDPDVGLDGLTDNLSEATNELAPIKEVRGNRKKWPGKIKYDTLWKKGDATYRRYKRTGNDKLLEEFTELRNKVTERTTTNNRNDFLQSKIHDAVESKKKYLGRITRHQIPWARKEKLYRFDIDKPFILRRRQFAVK